MSRPVSEPSSLARARNFLARHGFADKIMRFEVSTKTAAMAAEAVGCEVAQIVKSLVLMADDGPVLALVPGDRRADMSAIAKALGVDSVRMADPNEVRDATGYAIGGVCPFDLPDSLRVLIDESLGRFGSVYAACGTPDSVVPLSVESLISMTGGSVARVSAQGD